jgi:hypothetical protein
MFKNLVANITVYTVFKIILEEPDCPEFHFVRQHFHAFISEHSVGVILNIHGLQIF